MQTGRGSASKVSKLQVDRPMRRIPASIGLPIAAVLSHSALAQSADVPLVEAQGAWQLDAGEERCRLARVYGEAPDGHLLFLEQDRPSGFVHIAIASPTLKKVKRRKSIVLQFGNLPASEIEQYQDGNIGPFPDAVIIGRKTLNEGEPEDEVDPSVSERNSGLARIDTERYANVSQLAISQNGRHLLVLELPNFQSALDALNACSENFVSYWGLDLERHRTMQRGVRWTNSRQVADRLVSQYPTEALRRGEQGSVRFLAIVEKNGELLECRQSDITKLESLESPICTTMRHAEFEPAIDANGEPMKSYFVGEVRYVIP